jgi:hypothetical protein
MMIRLAAVFGLLATMNFSAAAQQMLSVNGMGIPLRCEDWKETPDGSWTQTGTIKFNGITLTGNILKGTSETMVLKEKCAPH